MMCHLLLTPPPILPHSLTLAPRPTHNPPPPPPPRNGLDKGLLHATWDRPSLARKLLTSTPVVSYCAAVLRPVLQLQRLLFHCNQAWDGKERSNFHYTGRHPVHDSKCGVRVSGMLEYCLGTKWQILIII